MLCPSWAANTRRLPDGYTGEPLTGTRAWSCHGRWSTATLRGASLAEQGRAQPGGVLYKAVSSHTHCCLESTNPQAPPPPMSPTPLPVRRDVVCGRDFTVILTWEGQVVDSRACLTNNAPHRHGGRTLAPLRNWPFPRHPVIAVAAGGAWSCELHLQRSREFLCCAALPGCSEHVG